MTSRLGWVALLAAGCSAAPAVQQAEPFEPPGVLELLCPNDDATLAPRFEVTEPLVVGNAMLTKPLALAAIGDGDPPTLLHVGRHTASLEWSSSLGPTICDLPGYERLPLGVGEVVTDALWSQTGVGARGWTLKVGDRLMFPEPLDLPAGSALIGPSFQNGVDGTALATRTAGARPHALEATDVLGFTTGDSPELFMARTETRVNRSNMAKPRSCIAWRTPIERAPLVARAFEGNGTRHLGLVVRGASGFLVEHWQGRDARRPERVATVAVPIARLAPTTSAGAALDGGVFRLLLVAEVLDGGNAVLSITFDEGAPRVESYPLRADKLEVARATLERREGDTSRPVWVALTASNELLAGGLDEATGLAATRERCDVGPQAPGSPFLSESGVTARQPLDATAGLGAVVIGACKGARVVTDRMIRPPSEPGWGPSR